MAQADEQTINFLLDYYNGWLGAPNGLLLAFATLESGYDPATGNYNNVCNSIGACGLMQLMPITIKDIYNKFGMQINPLNPIQAVVGGAANVYLIREYIRRVGGVEPDWAAITVGYNQGWRAGLRYVNTGAINNFETQNYLANVSSMVGI